MQDPSAKITIDNSDLNSSPPEPISISISELSSAVGQTVPDEPALNPSESMEPKLPLLVWAAVTVVPFMNALIWWRYAPRNEVSGSLFRVAATLMFLASLFGGGVMLWSVSQWRWYGEAPTNWVESVAQNADNGVVLIQSKPDSLGSGFVVASSSGEHLILTNRHVITDPDECYVGSRKSRVTAAQVVGYPKDEDIDLALLVVETSGLRPLGRVGSFQAARVGQSVVAIGHPLGLDYTISTGIISAKRGGVELQTSAPISPGNSGGPLIDQSGSIIGVNTRIVDPSEGASLGFAIRADWVLREDEWEFQRNVDHLLSQIQR